MNGFVDGFFRVASCKFMLTGFHPLSYLELCLFDCGELVGWVTNFGVIDHRFDATRQNFPRTKLHVSLNRVELGLRGDGGDEGHLLRGGTGGHRHLEVEVVLVLFESGTF